MAPKTTTQYIVEALVNRDGMDPEFTWDRAIRVFATSEKDACKIGTRIFTSWSDVDRVVSISATDTGETEK